MSVYDYELQREKEEHEKRVAEILKIQSIDDLIAYEKKHEHRADKIYYLMQMKETFEELDYLRKKDKERKE